MITDYLCCSLYTLSSCVKARCPSLITTTPCNEVSAWAGVDIEGPGYAAIYQSIHWCSVRHELQDRTGGSACKAGGLSTWVTHRLLSTRIAIVLIVKPIQMWVYNAVVKVIVEGWSRIADISYILFSCVEYWCQCVDSHKYEDLMVCKIVIKWYIYCQETE